MPPAHALEDLPEVFTNVPAADAAQQAVLALLRQMTSTMEGISARLDRHISVVDDVRERLIRLEERDKRIDENQQRIHDACQRLDRLEDAHQRREGALGFVGWIGKNAPWIGAIVIAALVAIGFKRGG